MIAQPCAALGIHPRGGVGPAFPALRGEAAPGRLSLGCSHRPGSTASAAALRTGMADGWSRIGKSGGAQWGHVHQYLKMILTVVAQEVLLAPDGKRPESR